MIFPFNIYNFLRSPEDYLLDLQKKHGDPFPLSFPGATTIWLTGNSDLAKIIFTAPADSFKTSDKNPVGPLLGKDGLIMQSGSTHLSTRKEFIPWFSKKSLLPFSTNIVDAFFEIHQNYERSGVFYIQELALKSTLKIILKFLFPHLIPNEMQEAERLTEVFLKSYSASFLFIPAWVPGTWNNFNQKKNELDDKFYEFFLSGIALGISSPLSALEGSSKSQVLDHIRTFIVAGHETSATSLSWALYYIHKDLYIRNRLQEELSIFVNNSNQDFVDIILSNQYLDSIVQESLRIRPPVPFITRKIINRDFNFGEKKLMIDEELGVCISLLHRQADTWSNSSEFKPDRFLDRKYSPYEFAPFGGGTRKCIGAELAVLELKILIGFMIKFFQAELLNTSIPRPEVMQITIGPKKPIALSFTKRFF
jgi:cytochrome P450